MADQFDPQEFADAVAAYENEVKTLGKATEATKMAFLDAKAGMRQYQAQVDASWKKLGKSAVDLGGALYKGEKGAGVFGNAVEEAATALSALILLIPGIGIAVKLAAVAIGAFGKAVNAAAKQGDTLYKTYQDLNKVGATTSDGITGVFNSMQNFGYGIEELDKMVKLVSENAETLAKFSLTAADGTNAFAAGMKDLQRDSSLRELGKTTDDINNAGAAYIRQTVRAGMSQKDIGDKLGAQTKEYILQVDRLQRLTGMSADALQKQQDEAMAEDAYNDVMSELKQRAAAGDEVAKMQIEKIATVMNKLGPEMRKEFILSVGGDVSAGSRLFMGMPNLMKNVMDETIDTQKTINDINKDATNTVNTFGKSARLAAGAFRDTMGPLYEYRETMVSTADFDARTDSAKKASVVTDKATKDLTELSISQMNSRDALQSFVQVGVAPAASALAKFAKITEAATGVVNMKAGQGGGEGAVSGRAGAGGAISGGAGGEGDASAIMDAAGGGRDLSNLRIKSSEATAGGESNPALIELANAIQNKLGGDLKYFSAFNDKYHQGLDRDSAHKTGNALDFTLTDPKQAATVASMIQSMPGVKKVINEYANLSSGGTGGHIHAEISAANGAILSGPSSGYRPNLTMHGTEAIVPLNQGMGAMGSSSDSDANLDLLARMVDSLEQLNRTARTQADYSQKIYQAAA
jgi:hypothetical protein